MKFSLTLIVTACLLLAMPETDSALWPPGANQGESTPAATSIIVKFVEGSEPKTSPPGDPLHTGIAVLDNLNAAFGITSQHKLLRPGTEAHTASPLRRVYVLELPGSVDFEAIAREYAALPMVEYAHPDYVVHLCDLPDDPLYPHQWALNNTGQSYYHVERIEGDNNDTLAIVSGSPDADIDAREVFDSPPDATHTIVVAIVDTGVDWDHPDLAGTIWNNPGEIPDNGLDDDHNGYVDDVVGWDLSAGVFSPEGPREDNDPTDEMGHGTHCAGIVAAAINNAMGVAGATPPARIMAVKCHPALTVSVLIRGVIYAAENGADVISMSWGTWFPMPALEEAMQFAHSRGVILVASAGNDGVEAWNYPASYPQTICVSASNSDDQITEWSTFSEWVNVCAPGQSILSLRAANTDMYADHHEPEVHIIDEQYYLASGTSMSGPYVAAVAAYLSSVSPGISPDSARTVIEASADDLLDPYGQGDSLPGWDMYSGHGRVNLYSALQAAPGLQAVIASPLPRAAVSGTVDILGTAAGNGFTEYSLACGTGFDPEQWTEITTSTQPVTNGLLGQWDAGGIEGPYTLRLQVGDNEASMRLWVIDSTIVEITSPEPHDTVAGLVPLMGSLVSPELAYAVLDHGEGPAPAEWFVADTLSAFVYQDVICDWDLTGLELGAWHTVRLTAFSDTGVIASDSVYVYHESIFSGDRGWTAPLAAKPGKTVNYGDFNLDGQLEIVIGTEAGVYFFTSEGMPTIAGMPLFPEGDFTTPLAVGNLDGDGFDDLVGVSDSGVIYAFPSSGNSFQIVLEETILVYFSGADDNAPTLYLKDINGDGLDEIHFCYPLIISTEHALYHVFRPDGSPWGAGFPLSQPFMRTFPADLDGDNICEMYSYNDSNHYLYQLDTAATALDSVFLEEEGAGLSSGHYQLSAVDIDGDDIHELVLLGAFLEDYIWSQHFVWAFDGGLNIMEGWPHTFGVPGFFGPSVSTLGFADLNQDGTLEYYLAYNHFDSFIRVWNLDGTSFVGGGTEGYFAMSPREGGVRAPVVADLDGDGYPDLLAGESGGELFVNIWEGLVAFDRFANLLAGYPVLVAIDYDSLDGAKGSVPVAGDLNQDGFIDYVYPWRDYLVFTNVDSVGYNENLTVQPMRRYNRQLNYTARLAGEIVTFCGDVNGDGHGPNIADVTYLVAYLFGSGAPPPDPEMADINGHDGTVNIVDLAHLVNYLFSGGGPPDCGSGPTR